MIAEIEPAELAERQRDPGRDPPVIVDVREPWEFAICRIEGSRSVPLGSLPAPQYVIATGPTSYCIRNSPCRS